MESTSGKVLMGVRINDDAIERLGGALDESLTNILVDHACTVFCAPGDDELDHYEHLRRGGCMLCGEPLGEDTIILVDAQGILGMFCGAECIQDMHIIPYLNEQIEGKLQRLMPEEG
jgi:hypothetical protein